MRYLLYAASALAVIALAATAPPAPVHSPDHDVARIDDGLAPPLELTPCNGAVEARSSTPARGADSKERLEPFRLEALSVSSRAAAHRVRVRPRWRVARIVGPNFKDFVDGERGEKRVDKVG